MILTKNISIKITHTNFDHYNLYMDNILIGETYEIPVELISNGSHVKIECQCDNCSRVNEVIYKNYLKYYNIKWGQYYCRKCSEFRRKDTLMRNHGCEFPMQSTLLYEKMLKSKKNI
jgi:late competence protein required for DNA uptake (superfamily II DNA/RNA helicase)